MIKLLTLTLCIVGSFSIAKGTDAKQDSILKSVLEKQIRGGDYEMVKIYSETDFLVTLPIIRDSLTAHGIYPVKNYSERIEELFGKCLDKGAYSVIDKLSGVSEQKMFTYTDLGETFYYYSSNEYGFIADFYPLPMLINYEKVFPSIVPIEEKLTIKKRVPNMETGKLQVVNVTKWKDMDNLNEMRQKTIMDLCAINKYCFQQDRNSFDYLVKNNWDFLDCLLKHGYDKDSILNAVFMKKISDLSKSWKQQQNVEYIFNKMSGSLKVNLGLLRSIKNSQSYMQLLYDFAINLYADFQGPVGLYSPLDENEPDKYYKMYTLSEKRKIMAYITSIYNPLFTSLVQKGKLKLRYQDTPIDVIRYWDEGLLQEIKDNNYYDIENLKEVIDSLPSRR